MKKRRRVMNKRRKNGLDTHAYLLMRVTLYPLHYLIVPHAYPKEDECYAPVDSFEISTMGKNDVPMLVTYSSDHDWEKHTTFDIENVFGTNSECYIAYDDTIPPMYDDYNDEYDIFIPPTIEEKIYCDYNMPPIFD